MRFVAVLLVMFAAACAGAPQGRAPLVPPLDPEQPKVVADRRVPADADRTPPAPAAPREPMAPSSSEPVYRSVIETVEVPSAADRQAGTSPADDRVYVEYVASQGGRRDRGPDFPINTAVGAGIGAIIGHQSGHRDTGALVGAGVGLMLDLQRWLR